MTRFLKKETLPVPQSEVFPLSSLCCCECASWGPRLLARGRASENLLKSLGTDTESCNEQFLKNNTSTKGLTQYSEPHELAQLE